MRIGGRHLVRAVLKFVIIPSFSSQSTASYGTISGLSFATFVISCQVHRRCQPLSCAGYQLKMDGYVQVKVILGSYGSTTELSGWQTKHA